MAEGRAEPGSHSLSGEEIGRYGRQLILPEWGVKGRKGRLGILMYNWLLFDRSVLDKTELSADRGHRWTGISCHPLPSCCRGR